MTGRIDLSKLTPDIGFVIQGDEAFDQAGWSVSTAGDVNGDGIDDLIVGAPDQFVGLSYYVGKAYVIYGHAGTTRTTLDLTSLAPDEGYVIQGVSGRDRAGWSVSSAGDVNGDGIDDLMVGVPRSFASFTYAGEAYVVYGIAETARTIVNLAELGPSDGFRIQGDAQYDSLGFSVSAAGDVNGDGIDDVIVGAPGGDDGGSEAGEAYVIYGVAGSARRLVDVSTLEPSEGYAIQGDTAADNAGFSVSSAGDVNGDGINDLIVGAESGDDGGANAGEAYVVYGVPGTTRTVVDLTDLAPSDGFIIQGDEAFDEAGFSVSSAGDVNADGIDDLIVGAPDGDDGGSYAGEAYVIYGVVGNTRTSVDLTLLAASDGFIIQGDTAGDHAGYSVATAGDVNGDGIDDLIVGAPGGDDGGEDAGEAYVIFGAAGESRTEIDLSALAPSDGYIIQGDEAGDRAGHSVSSAGDINSDGFDDLIVGAPYGDDGGSLAGEAYVIYGSSSAPPFAPRPPSVQPEIRVAGDNAGNVIEGAGLNDLIIGLEGDDLLIGNDGDDRLRGGAGSDEIIGGAGFDSVGYLCSNEAVTVNLSAGFGIGGEAEGDTLDSIETVVGSQHDDTLIASDRGQDWLLGAGGDDILVGGGSFDQLWGGRDTDVLIGGGGGDLMLGGLGADVFVIEVAGDSTLGASGQDRIGDFSGQAGDGDLLHVSAVVVAGGSYSNAGVFSNTAGEFISQVQDGNTLVLGDLDGDGVADMAILLDGLVTLTAADFVF